ncbi:choline dehydrogenase [Aureobasidium pullulans]|uniref:Choline dehydrogenase n=1 Tax=Aureobasidium pullulans TaxID=5580 RepID=A0A4V4JB41_AURPU|nr:choline dehydrogenase [Aureobasidium pullulans]THX25165.1 choline dehydrogenase [Aureobasidium pullulans]THX50158.1 choline dehydrogenase [Aureobasidium pullulans]THZ31995.1 choline dehydrogenase [Aureobasidium pullulans]
MAFSRLIILSAFYSAAYAGSWEPFEYDYIIVGGGTAGCVLANRLSANPSISVALIEAGPTVFNDSRVLSVSPGGPAWNTELDWQYTTTPQVYANNSTLLYHAGRDLGGSSTLNGMVYLRPTADEVDSWSALGNPGLTWDNLLPYFKKSEHLQLPTEPEALLDTSYEASFHGFNGPVKVGWGNDLNTTGYGRALNSSWQSLGFSWNLDPNSGDTAGLGLFPLEKDTVLNIRSDSARSYVLPVISRPNLHAFTNTTALDVDLDGVGAHHGPRKAVVAKGVNVILPSGKKQALRSKREVILSAGTYRTPGLLERSGVGNPSVLRNMSVTLKVNLPGVGAHLQDQWLLNVIVNPNFTLESLTIGWNARPLTASLTAADVFEDDLDTVAAQLYKDIPSYARILSEASGGAISVQAQEQILRLRADTFFKKGVAIGAMIFQVFGGNHWVTLPLSTGTVHSSSDPSRPNLNPNFMQLPWDIMVMQRLSQIQRKIFASPEMQAALGPSATVEILPGYSNVPANASLAQWTVFYRASLAPVWHAVGSAGMRRRDWGGVVDTKFRVYGVQGLRIADASVIPLELNGNPTSTIYALAEKAAEDILADCEIGKGKPWS